MFKRTLSVMLSLSLLCCPLFYENSQAVQFSDVSSSDWFFGAVDYCAQNQLFRGTSDTTFSPNDTMTRGQFVTVLGRMEHVDTDSVVNTSKFHDVAADSYYTPYVYWANANGIVNGTSNSTFSPDTAITREQMATILANTLRAKSLRIPAADNAVSSFRDMDSVSAYAICPVNTLRQCGILNGDEQRRVLPQKSMTRAEAATVFMNLQNKLDSAVSDLGALHVSGSQLLDEKNNPIQLKGISTHGLAWYPDYINNVCFQQLNKEMGVNVIRLAMYTAEYGGYCSGGNQTKLKQLIDDGVRYASANHMYVMIDWHILSDGNPLTHQKEAISFFEEMAAKYANDTNVLYEICNEPNGGTSWAQIKQYANAVIPAIRRHTDAVILVGTPTWSQDVDQAASNPITGFDNIMYTLHFYAGTHQESLRQKMTAAVKKGLPVFVSEFGICDASGSGSINEEQANRWVQVMNQYNISYVSWNLSNKSETSSLLKSSCGKVNGFTSNDFSPSGQWLIRTLTGRNVIAGNIPEETPSVPSVIPPSSEITQDALRAEIQLTNQWNSGNSYFYQYSVVLKNTSSSDITGWSLSIPFNTVPILSQGWCGSFSVNGQTMTITPANYNQTVPANGAITNIGFIVQGSAGLAVTS